VVPVLVVLAACSSSPQPSHPPVGVGRVSPGRHGTRKLHIRPAGYGLPAPVQREVAVARGGTIYLAGGLGSSGSSVDGVFALDPASGRVRSLGSVPVAFHDAAGAFIAGRLVIFGGGPEVGTSTVQAFDPATGRASVIGRLPRALSDLSAATVGDTTYVIGGYDGVSPRPDVYSTRDGSRFARVAALPSGLRYAAIAAARGRVLVAGGISSSGPVAAVRLFDPVTQQVTHLAQLPVPLAHAAAVALGGMFYVIGGQDAAGRPLRSVFEVDPATGHVRTLAPLGLPVSDAGVATIGSTAWLIGGWRGTSTSQVLRISVGA